MNQNFFATSLFVICAINISTSCKTKQQHVENTTTKQELVRVLPEQNDTLQTYPSIEKPVQKEIQQHQPQTPRAVTPTLESAESQKLFSIAALPTTTRIINPKEDNTIVGKHGSIVILPKLSLVNTKGVLVTENVEITIKEAVNKKDIIFSGLTTQSNERFLETGGMLFIGASANGEELQLSNGATVNIKINALALKKDFQLFEGEQTAKGINWKDPIPMFKLNDKDTIKPIATLQGRGWGGCCFMCSNNEEWAGTNLSINSPRLGWCNIDRFYNAPNTEYVNMRTTIDQHATYSDMKVSLILTQSNLYLNANLMTDNTFSFTGSVNAPKLPLGERAMILATAKKSGKFYSQLYSFVIAQQMNIKLTLQETTKMHMARMVEEKLNN
jgi:hypothetical protein